MPTVHGIMLVPKLSKTNAAFQLSNLPAALKIERSIGRQRVAKSFWTQEEEKEGADEMLEMDEHAEDRGKRRRWPQVAQQS